MSGPDVRDRPGGGRYPRFRRREASAIVLQIHRCVLNGLRTSRPEKCFSLSVTITHSFVSATAATIISRSLLDFPAARPSDMRRAQTNAAFSSNGNILPLNSDCGPSGPANQASNRSRFFPFGLSTFKLKEIWAIRVRLQIAGRCRELALFNLAVDSKLRACDLVQLRVRDVCHGQSMASRAMILRQKAQRPVQFEITEPTRDAVSAWLKKSALNSEDFLYPSRIQESPHLSTRQYARIVDSWVQLLGLDTTSYGTHTLRRTKATLIYRRTKNLQAVQLLLGHSKLESTVRYLGIEVDDALEMAEQTDV